MRYAIYFAPPHGSPLNSLGSSWLGRDAHTGALLAQPAVEGIAAVTADPRRYGFHATLKAPFSLREGVAPDHLVQTCAALAADIRDFRVKLRVGLLDGFLALRPEATSGLLQDIAARMVRELDHFRKPPIHDELVRRRKTPLTPRQEDYLMQWGYPYVFDEFRFHMTLTQRLPADHARPILAAAEAHFGDELSSPLTIDGVTLFQEKEPGAPFLVLRHFPFIPSAAEVAA